MPGREVAHPSSERKIVSTDACPHKDLGVGARGGGIALPLVSFNLGVETG